MKYLLVIVILLLSVVIGYTYLSNNHYFCGDVAGESTRQKEKQAKSLPKYPNAQRYTIESSCGGLDGLPQASIKFITTDEKNKVESFYTDKYVNYDERKDRDSFKWWNVEIDF